MDTFSINLSQGNKLILNQQLQELKVRLTKHQCHLSNQDADGYMRNILIGTLNEGHGFDHQYSLPTSVRVNLEVKNSELWFSFNLDENFSHQLQTVFNITDFATTKRVGLVDFQPASEVSSTSVLFITVEDMEFAKSGNVLSLICSPTGKINFTPLINFALNLPNTRIPPPNLQNATASRPTSFNPNPTQPQQFNNVTSNRSTTTPLAPWNNTAAYTNPRHSTPSNSHQTNNRMTRPITPSPFPAASPRFLGATHKRYPTNRFTSSSDPGQQNHLRFVRNLNRSRFNSHHTYESVSNPTSDTESQTETIQKRAKKNKKTNKTSNTSSEDNTVVVQEHLYDKLNKVIEKEKEKLDQTDEGVKTAIKFLKELKVGMTKSEITNLMKHHSLMENQEPEDQNGWHPLDPLFLAPSLLDSRPLQQEETSQNTSNHSEDNISHRTRSRSKELNKE